MNSRHIAVIDKGGYCAHVSQEGGSIVIYGAISGRFSSGIDAAQFLVDEGFLGGVEYPISPSPEALSEFFGGHRTSRIVCAAHKTEWGEVFVGVRHMDSFVRAAMDNSGVGKDARANTVQGFVDQYGEFFDRCEAWKIAEREGHRVRSLGHRHRVRVRARGPSFCRKARK